MNKLTHLLSLFVVLVPALAASAAAQDEGALRSALEGRHVTLKIDMPATSDGVDVRADARQALDSRQYGDRIKRFGTSLRSGESVMVTLVKLKKDLIEFQLNGGGFGTFGDDTSTSVYIPHMEKSTREKDLEKRVKDETDSRRKRQLQDELDDVRERRERENRRIDAERVRAEEIKKERIAVERLKGGSRFNLRYSGSVPSGIRPEEIMAALADYVDFAPAGSTPAVTSKPATSTGNDAADLLPRKGMTRADAERAFGNPRERSDRREGTLLVSTLIFDSGDRRITAEFVEDVLIRFTIASR